MTRDKLIETMARAMFESDPRNRAHLSWDGAHPYTRKTYLRRCASALTALESSGMVVVPRCPDARMRGAGSARAAVPNPACLLIWNAMLAASPTQRDASSDRQNNGQ